MPHYAAEMQPKIEFNNVVKPRIHGKTAVRIVRLAKRVGLSENQIANRAAEAGIAEVEKEFRNVNQTRPSKG